MQMEYVARNYSLVTLDDLLLFLKEQKEIPPNSVAVTFDDGYADNVEIAAPVLNRFGIRAAFYVTVDCIETGMPPWPARLRYAFATTTKATWSDPGGCLRPLQGSAQPQTAFLLACEKCACLAGESQQKAIRAIEHDLEVEPLTSKHIPMLTWDQVRRLSRYGHTAGSHTLTHPNLAHVQDSELSRELMGSKSKLEKELSAPVVHFSYPSPALEPHWTERTVEMTRKVGYLTAVTSSSGLVRNGDNPLFFRRLAIPTRYDEFIWSLSYARFPGRRM
jgi:peptidoglycan/xylan/chitin deacetylase (PgdA/CDA1 family)